MNEKLEEETKLEIVGKHEADIRKVYITNYGNLTLEILQSNEIGIEAYSPKRSEFLFIPWTSIIFVSKIVEDIEKNSDG